MLNIYLKSFIIITLSALAAKLLSFVFALNTGQSELFFQGFLYGLRFDLAAVFILLTFIVLISTLYFNTYLFKVLLAVAIAWLVFTTLANSVYFIEAGRHLTFEVFNSEDSLAGLLSTLFINHSVIAMVFVGLYIALFFLVVKIKFNYSLAKASITKKLINKTVFFIVFALIAVTVIRGGWKDHPQEPLSAYKVGITSQAKYAWSAPYAIAYYLIRGQKFSAQQITAKPTEKDVELVNKYFKLNKKQELKLPSTQANIIFVLLESWAAVDSFHYYGEVNATPNFDKKLQESFSTRAFYADAYRTVEGMFAGFCSFTNPVGGGVGGTQLQTFNYQCLPQLLNDLGWQTIFIQGSGMGIVGSFAQSLGFKESLGKFNFGFEGTKNSWGYMDDDIYKFSLQQIKQASFPYFIAINTGTTHDAFLPKDEDFVFGKATRDERRRSVVHHADAALGRFLANLEAEVKEPSLVVLMSDHTASVAEQGLAQNAIPFLIYGLNMDLPIGIKEVAAAQVDIAPTIIDRLGGYVPWFVGTSLLSDEYQGFGYFSKGQTVNWIEDKQLVSFGVLQDQQNCKELADNGIDYIKDITCNEVNLQKAKSFIKYTQQLLFKGKTTSY